MYTNFSAPEAHILIVDDMPVNLKMTEQLLKPLNMQIDTACNGKEALDKILSNDYDLVLMDHMMPVMDGATATAEIRKQPDEKYKKLPVIALTSCTMDEASSFIDGNGFSDYLNKPVNKDELLSCIHKWLPEHKIGEGSKVCDDQEAESKKEDEPLNVNIPGIDPKVSIRNSGGTKLFLGLLGDVYGIIEDKCALIEKLLEDNAIKDYTIQVHALKTTCRMIGAMELAEKFRALERLGNANDITKIKEETPLALSGFRALLPYLAPYAADEKVAEKEYDPQIIGQILSDLTAAMEDFNLTAAQENMEHLISFRYPGDLSQKIKDLEKLVVELDYDLALPLADSILNSLS